MIKVLASLTAALTVSFAVGLYSFQSPSRIAELQKSQDQGKITWWAKMAKAKGEREITLGAPLIRYAVPRSMEEALAHYNVVVAEPVASKSSATTYDIHTWYKFRVIEELSTATQICTTCSKGPEPPSELLPLNEGEFIASKVGGEALVDEVKIVTKDIKFPPFEINQRYLLFIAFDATKTIGALRMGPWGTFTIASNGKLTGVDQKLKHHVSDEIGNRFAGSLDQLRQHLKTKNSNKTNNQ